MGTRWSAILHAAPDLAPRPLKSALARAVAEVDAQMSTWKDDSDLMRLNRSAADRWIEVPAHLMTVLEAGLAIGRASGGAFDIGMGDAVTAWGFRAADANADRIKAALAAPRRPAHEVLELDPDNRRLRKHGPIALDLCGIAKGYGVDRLAETARDFGIESALLSIDGELRTLGTQPEDTPWAVAVERPDYTRRTAHSVLTLTDASVATSGDYRHWVEVGATRLSHTMDPSRGAPLAAGPASATVIAPVCMLADGWATAMMVMDREAGAALARRIGLSVLFIDRDGETLSPTGIGPVFETATEGA